MEDYKRILLVEDSENDIEIVLQALSEYKLRENVDVARDGEEAMDYLMCRNQYAGRKTGNPILTLLDIGLPKLNGLEVLNRIKEDEKLRTIPVVILTSSEVISDRADSYRYGVNAYVVKPIEFQKFTEIIKDLSVYWATVNEPPPYTPV
jgi:CheY-like chemotaxis protein